MLSRLIRLINRTLKNNHNLPADERIFLRETKKRLKDVRRRYRANENKFASLFSSLDMGYTKEIMTKTEHLKRLERLLNEVLSGIENDVHLHIRQLSKISIEDSKRASWALVFMSIVALITGIAIVLATRRLLSPLKTLQKAVSKVASGDLDIQINIERNDEIGLLAQNFNRMTNALKDRNKMLIRQERLATAGRIAAQVTHEIRNPLSSLGLNAELLEEDIIENKSPEETIKLLGAMKDEIDRLTRITESYLQFARLPAPLTSFHNLNKLITDIMEFMKGETEGANISVEINQDNMLDKAVFDKGQIRQAFINLVRNAIDAISQNGHIIIKTEKVNNTINISVSDNGPGIDEKMEPFIFDAFYTTKSEGTGLGLAMVRQICLAHGGNITYKKLKPTGSQFTIILPVITIETKK
jgi:signal transduction histidine kinase